MNEALTEEQQLRENLLQLCGNMLEHLGAGQRLLQEGRHQITRAELIGRHAGMVACLEILIDANADAALVDAVLIALKGARAAVEEHMP
jgi:hypothetical protein